ncbi:MAG: hypothetical protein ACRDOO_23660 [Actinomadura sp.]
MGGFGVYADALFNTGDLNTRPITESRSEVSDLMEVANVGTDFYFAPAAGATWSLFQRAFTEALVAQWPEASVQTNQFDAEKSYVGLLVETRQYDGFFTNTENLVVERGTAADAAELVEWFLGLLPQDARIRFSSEIAVESGIHDDWWLTRDAGRQQIAEALTDHLAAVLAGDS